MAHSPTHRSDPVHGWRGPRSGRRGRRRAHLALSSRIGRPFWEHLDRDELEQLQRDHEQAAADIADVLRRRGG